MTSVATATTFAARSVLARRKDYTWRPPRMLAILAVSVVVAAYVLVARSATYPLIPRDEMAMIADSRVIAGDGGAWPMTGGGFMPGLAVLMAPVWWFTSDPVVVYLVGIWITVVVALATIWPLALLARKVGASTEAGIVVASAVMIAPARVLVTNILLSETLITFATALVAVSGIRLWRTRHMRDAALLGLASGFAVLAHSRGIAIAAAAGLWSLLLLRRHRAVAIVAAVTISLSSLAALAVYVWVSPGGSEGFQLPGNAHRPAGMSVNEIVASLIGQLWYATLAWPLVVLLGAGLVLWHARRRIDIALILLMVVLSVGLSTSQLTHPTDISRIDTWFYGRYNDHVWTLLATIGCVLAVRWIWPAAVLAVAGVAGVLGILMFVVTVPKIPDGDAWQDLHVFGVAPWLSWDRLEHGRPQQWALLCFMGFAFTLVLGMLSLLRAWIVPVLAIGWLALSLTYDANVFDPHGGDRDPNTGRWGFSVLPQGTTIGVDASAGQLRNLVIFAARSRPIVAVDVEDYRPDVEVVYTWNTERAPAADGARVLALTSSSEVVAWVYPGSLYKELDDVGLLLPAGDLASDAARATGDAPIGPATSASIGSR